MVKGKTMNDLISRKALLAEYDRVHIGEPGKARKMIEDATAVDAVEVVRCKDCKQWCRNSGITESPNGHCFNIMVETNGYDFCSYGERKDNGNL